MSVICLNARYQQFILIVSIFFFFNVYLLYNTATNPRQNHSSDQEKSIIHKQQGKPSSSSSEHCEITDELAISALKRVKSATCRTKIEEAACLLKEGTFHDKFPTSQCPNHDNLLIDFRVGCFSDQKKDRVLKDFEYKFKTTNSRDFCRKHCYKAGFLYYGLEFGLECFCGNKIDKPAQLQDQDCHTYPCPGNQTQFCGGYNAVEIFHTGLKKEVILQKPKYIENAPETDKKAKILFLLQLNGRNERQVKRFLKSIYSPYHYYYVHIDKRQWFMLSEMQKIVGKVPNMVVSYKRFSTIWGGASLLQMFQEIIRDSLQNELIQDWDYIVNFSESDFPVLPITDFENLINSNIGNSFLASHGYNTGRFIQKQGFEFVFLECEERMWRIGKRDFPGNLRIDGGSDWVGIHRDLAEYSVSDEELPTKLRKLFESILLPLESFYHTLSHNSKFCNNVMSSNLRLTNWYRKQGCRCAGLKKVVDWCGCSPLVFRNDTMPKFDLEKVKAKPSYFARKFDSMVNIDAIAAAEIQSVPADSISIEHPSYNSAFSSIYKRDVDGLAPHFFNFANSIFEMSEGSKSDEVVVKKLQRIDAFRANSTAPIQIVLTIETDEGETQILVDRLHHFEVFEHSSVGGYTLKNMTFGTRFEYKEEVCREYMGIVTDKTTVQLRMVWEPSNEAMEKKEKTSPEVEVRWKKPDSTIIAANHVKPYDSVFGGQFDEVDLAKNLKTEAWNVCGSYSADIVSTVDPNEVIGTLSFPVYPTNDPKCHLKLSRRFFNVIDSCSNDDCAHKIWSISYPDPKSDILHGYDFDRKMLY